MNEVLEHSVWNPTHHATHPRPPCPTATSNEKHYYTITTGVPQAMVHCWESAADDLATAMLQGALMGSTVALGLSAQQQQQQQQEEEEAFCHLEGLRSTVVPVSTHPQCMTLAQLLEQAEMSRTITSRVDFYDYGTHAADTSSRSCTRSDSSGNGVTSSTATNSMPSKGPAMVANRAVGSARVSLTLSDGTRVSTGVFRAPTIEAAPAAVTPAEKDTWVRPVPPAGEIDNRDSEAAAAAAAVTAVTLATVNVTGDGDSVMSANAAPATAHTVTAAAAVADKAVQSPTVGDRPRVQRCVSGRDQISPNKQKVQIGQRLLESKLPHYSGVKRQHSHCISIDGCHTSDEWNTTDGLWYTADGWSTAAPSKRQAIAALAPQQDSSVGTVGSHVSQLDELQQQQKQQLMHNEQQQHFDMAKHNDECPYKFSELVCDDLSVMLLDSDVSDMLLDGDLSDMLLDGDLSSFNVQQQPLEDQIQHDSRLTTRGSAFSDDSFGDIWDYLTTTQSTSAGAAGSAAAAAAMYSWQAAWEPKQLLAVDGLMLGMESG